MIVSHQHRFVFVKTRKTAGTSIEAFLISLHDPETRGTAWEMSGDHGRFNPLPELVYRPRFARQTIRQAALGRRYFEHMPAWRVRNRVGRKNWDDYFTFCFERNPWDKLVSFYYWRTKTEQAPLEFEPWVRSTPNLSAWPLYTIDGEVVVDLVGRYESLEQDMQTVLARIGVERPLDLTRAKSGVRPADADVHFTPALDAWVAHEFRHEIDLMGYEAPQRR